MTTPIIKAMLGIADIRHGLVKLERDGEGTARSAREQIDALDKLFRGEALLALAALRAESVVDGDLVGCGSCAPKFNRHEHGCPADEGLSLRGWHTAEDRAVARKANGIT